MGTAIGPLFGGLALDLIGLNEGMLPGQIHQNILNDLVWVFAIGVVPLMLVALYFTTRFSMSERQLLDIQKQLAARTEHS